MSESKQEIQSFLKQQGLHNSGEIRPITNSASPRKYYRVLDNGQSYVLTQSDNREENRSFFYYTENFEKVPILVPQILAISEDESLYLQKDLGDENFLSLLQQNHSDKADLIATIMKDLASMQVELPQYIDFEKSYEFQNFDEKIILNDLFYFKNYFLEYLEIPFQKQKLIQDFYSLVDQALALPNRYFMYRDFQSRNIMIFEGKPYYIDYQGGLQGIASYDCVSFSWQAKAQFTETEKESIKQMYFSEMQKRDAISTEDLEQSYQLSLVLRLFQLLGAYGFRGLVQGKKHFKESIQNTLVNIQYLVQNEKLNNYPELQRLSEQYLKPEKINV